jgi:glutamate decarboxylase
MEALRDTATWLSDAIAQMGCFEPLSDGGAVPVFAFRVRDLTPFSVFYVSDRLRERGWQVPAYTMLEGAEDVAVLRIVVREGFSRDMATMLLDDLKAAVEQLENHPPAHAKETAQNFAH